VYLERRSTLHVVAEIDGDLLDGIDLFDQPIFWSPETWEVRSRHGVKAELLACALTPTPASVALPPVHVLAGTVDTAACRTHGPLAGILTRAAQARSRDRYSGDPLRIHDLDTGPAAIAHRGAVTAGPAEYRRPAGPIEHWPGGGRILSVR
jgi:hypothetical protein